MPPATHSSNNFDFLRFFAATLVWYWHCYALRGMSDPFAPFIHFESPGNIGVAIFFVISGYFVTASYVHHNRLGVYARNRLLRIFPAMIAVILLCVFVMGPLVTTLSLRDYFSDPETWKYLRSLLIFPLQYRLPGVFRGNPSDAVNGSLWTLQHEARLYIVVGMLGVLGILRLRMAAVLFAILYSLRVYSAFPALPYHDFFQSHWAEGKLLLIQLASLFAAGAVLFLGRAQIPLRKEIFAIAVLLLIASTRMPDRYGVLLFEFAFPYAVIYLGYLRLPLLPHFGRFGDFSYGMYLYAFPVQQVMFLWLGAHSSFRLFMIASFAATLFCAVLSWHFIEKPALARKR